MPPKQELTVFLKYVPVMEVIGGVEYIVDDTIEISPDPAFLDEGQFNKVEWVALNGGGQLNWTIRRKSNSHVLATINHPDNSAQRNLSAAGTPLLYKVEVSGTSIYGHTVSASKDPEIHWGRRGG